MIDLQIGDDDDDFWLSSSDDEDEPPPALSQRSSIFRRDEEPVSWMDQWATTTTAVATPKHPVEKPQPQQPSSPPAPPVVDATPSFLPQQPQPPAALTNATLAGWASVSLPGTQDGDRQLWYCQIETSPLQLHLSRMDGTSRTLSLSQCSLQVDYVSPSAGQALVIRDCAGQMVVSILPVLVAPQKLDSRDAIVETGPWAPPEQQDAILHWRFALDMMLRMRQ